MLECFPTYAVFHFTGERYDFEEALEFTTVIDTHYKNRNCVVISSRQILKTVNPEVYSHFRSKSVVAVAIVSNCNEVREQVTQEQSHYTGAFTFFTTLEEAICWAETVVKHD